MVCDHGKHAWGVPSGKRPGGAVGSGLCAQRGRKGSRGRSTGPSGFLRRMLATVPSMRYERSPGERGWRWLAPISAWGRTVPQRGFSAALLSREVCFPSDEGCSRRLPSAPVGSPVSSAQPGGSEWIPTVGLPPTVPSVTSSPRAGSPAPPGPCLPRALPCAGVPAPLPSAGRSRLQHASWGQPQRGAHTHPRLPVRRLTPRSRAEALRGPWRLMITRLRMKSKISESRVGGCGSCE